MTDDLEIQTKTCRCCWQTKSLLEFNLNRNKGARGYMANCRLCQNSMQRRYRKGKPAPRGAKWERDSMFINRTQP